MALNKAKSNKIGITLIILKTLWMLLQIVMEKKLLKHLLTVSENAICTSPPYVTKYIDIVNDLIKTSLLAPLRMRKYITFNDGARSISSTQSIAIYGTFQHMNTICENHIGMMQISEPSLFVHSLYFFKYEAAIVPTRCVSSSKKRLLHIDSRCSL